MSSHGPLPLLRLLSHILDWPLLLCREQGFSTGGIRLDRLWWLGCLSSPSHSPASLPLPFPPPTLPSKPLPVSGRSLHPPSGKKLLLGGARLAHLPSPLTLNC